jgi:hypothetical protein
MAEVEALNRDFIREHRRVLDGAAPTDSARRKALYGNWIGEIESFRQVGKPDSFFKAPIQFALMEEGQAIAGKGSFVLKDETFTFSLTGDMTSDEHTVALTYNHPSPRFAFGNMILRFDDEAKHLSGKAVGYGSLSQQIVFGTVAAKKVKVPRGEAMQEGKI